MANPNINIGVINESSVTSQTQVGKILFTDQGNQYIVKSDGSKMKISDIIVVSALPSIGQPLKIYILNNSGTYTMNIYDTTWHAISGSSSGTSFTDWVASTNYTINTSFVLNNNNLYRCNTTHTSGTSFSDNSSYWTLIGHIHDNKTQLDKISEDSITGEMKYNNQAVINVDVSNRSNGKTIVFNSTTGRNEYSDINITGIVGSSQITVAGENITIPSGNEITFNHPISTNIIPVIEEHIAGSSVTDTRVDFSDSSKYTLQDSGKILVGNNKVELDIYTKLLMHMDESTFKDECGHTVINTNVTLDTTNKIFGLGSAYFNNSSYLSIADSEDWNFGTGDFTIKFKILFNTIQTENVHLIGHFSSALIGWYISMNIAGQGYLSFRNQNNTNILTTNSSVITQTNKIYEVALIRNNGILTFYIDGNASGSVNYNSAIQSVSHPLWIGTGDYSSHAYLKNAYMDEVLISKKALSFTTSSLPYKTPYITTNTPIFLKTTGLSDFSLTTTDTITSLMIPTTIPTNTSVKCLFSVDNYTNYLYYDGTNIQKFTGDLNSDWGSTSSTVSQIQNLFTSLTITNLTSMLSSLGITPVNLDLVFQLNTQITTDTPTIYPITMVYTTKPHTEFASFGGYDESYSKFAIKRLNNSQLSIRNNTTKSRIINVNLVTSV